MNKEIYKKFIFPGLVCITGMLSVSVANVFGNHYGFVALLVIVLSALYAYNLFEGELKLKQHLINIGLVGFILLSELLFFVVNDLFNISVYVKGYTTFWGVLVIVSQIISVCGLIYLLVNFVVENRKTSVEVIEQDSNLNEEKEIIEEERTSISEEQKEEIEVRFISNINSNENVPFMEEEK